VAVLRPRTLSTALTTVSLAALAGAVALALRWPDIDVMAVIVTVVLALPVVTVGMLVGLRSPYNPVGPLISLQAATFVTIFGWQGAYDEAATRHPGSLPVWPSLAVTERGSWTLLFLPVGLLLLLFPTGHHLTPRWRWVSGALVAVAVSFPVIAAFSPRPLPRPYQALSHPFGTAPLWLQAVGWVELPILLGLLVASAVSMVLRYRRSANLVERAQVRWLALGAWALPVTLLLSWVGLLLLGSPDLAAVGLSAMAVTIPASVAVAMLRHNLYDVDRALSVAITYSVLTGLLLAVATVTEIVVGALLGRGSGVVAAAATAVAALAIAPIRRRAGEMVDRRIYPMRAELHRVLADLRRDIDAGIAQPEDVESALRRALQAPRLRVGYLAPSEAVAAAASGEPVPSGIPVTLAGTRIGVIDPGPTPASKELMREVADAAALYIEFARLRLGLARAMSEVSDSRSRLLRHGYQERHKLQRDLHDGAQQRLVALGMSLRLAQRHLHDDGFDVDGLLDQAMTQLGTAVAELRTIAAGLRPPALDSGLAAAIRSLAATVPLPVELTICDDNVPDDVATTAYYVVSEGLSNAMKHAQARRVRVSLSREGHGLRVEVSDDGIGGAQHTGSGLSGLADRVAAASGRLRVISALDAGTRLEAVLPCAS
jgi:signal transduction histidine kinase